MLLLLVPLALIPASFLFSACAGYAHGVMVSRSAALVMALIALWGAVLPLGRLFAASTAQGRRAWLASPMAWALAAIAWQACVWLILSPVLEPGLPWMFDRAAALMVACVVWACCAQVRVETPRVAWALAMTGAVLLALAAFARFGAGFARAAGAQGTDADVGGLLSALSSCCDRLGLDAPFGNQNFDISGALPLLGMSCWLWLRERQHRPRHLALALLVLGWASALAIACGLRDDGTGEALPLGRLGGWLAAHGMTRREGVAGAALELCAGAALALALWLLPRRLQLPACLLGFAALLTGIFLCTVGALPPPGHSPSVAQRPWMWRCAVTAIGHAPVAGYGVGSAVAVLDHQDAYSEAYLTVPSYPEQAHDEVLETLLDGGVVNLVLVAGLLVVTLLPLWRRRDEPVAAALLIAWTMLIVHALVDVELSQAGPVLTLALLGGVSWYVAREGETLLPERPLLAFARRASSDDGAERSSIAWRALPLAAGCALLAYSVCELTGVLGNVPELEVRHARLDRGFARAHDAKARLAAVERLVAQVGDLDENQRFIAELRLEQDPPDVKGARAACLSQSEVLPIMPDNVMLMVRLMRLSLSVGEADVPTQLAERIRACIARMRLCLSRVGDNGKNHQVRVRMEWVVAHADELLESAPHASAQDVQAAQPAAANAAAAATPASTATATAAAVAP